MCGGARGPLGLRAELPGTAAEPGRRGELADKEVLLGPDAAGPLGLLRSIRDALRPGGTYLCLDINCSDRAEANVGPIATLLYGFSVLYCMTTSLAEGGEGLGTLGLPAPALRELAAKAGFAQVRQVEMDNPFNNLYELTR